MLGSEQLTEHQRVFAALGGLAGLRLGASVGLRWGDLDVTAGPLWRLTSSRTYDGKPTKTGKPSIVPVHPVLAEMLTSWRHGWGQLFGRTPTAEDPIVPRAPGNLMDSILETLGNPAYADEVPRAALDLHLHRAEGRSRPTAHRAHDAHDGQAPQRVPRYDRADRWPQLCAEVAKMRITPKSGGRVLGQSPSSSSVKMVEAPGVEGGKTSTTVHLGAATARDAATAANPREPPRTTAVASRATAASLVLADLVEHIASVIELQAGNAQWRDRVKLAPGFAHDVARNAVAGKLEMFESLVAHRNARMHRR